MGIIYLPDGRFLIARRPDHKMYGGLWEFPGGKLDAGETPEQALQREFAEELNVAITIDRALEEYQHHNGQASIRFLPFIGSMADTNISLLEHQQAVFIRVTEIDDYPFAPPDYEIVNRLKQCA